MEGCRANAGSLGARSINDVILLYFLTPRAQSPREVESRSWIDNESLYGATRPFRALIMNAQKMGQAGRPCGHLRT